MAAISCGAISNKTPKAVASGKSVAEAVREARSRWRTRMLVVETLSTPSIAATGRTRSAAGGTLTACHFGVAVCRQWPILAAMICRFGAFWVASVVLGWMGLLVPLGFAADSFVWRVSQGT